MKTKLKILLVVGIFVSIAAFPIYYMLAFEASPDWVATYQKGYIPDDGGYYVELQKNVWTYADGRKDSSLFVFIDPDTTVDTGRERLSIFTIDFDIDGKLNCIRFWKRPNRPLTKSEYKVSGYEVLPDMIQKSEAYGKWVLVDGDSPSLLKVLTAKVPYVQNLNDKALRAVK